jgi:ATP-dependent Clp protease ATP-binding subunit ClpC
MKHLIDKAMDFNWEVSMPERAIDLATEVFLYWKKEAEGNGITVEVVDRYLSLKTGIKHGDIESSEKRKLLNLEEILHQRVVGQEEAIRQLAEAMRRARTGLGGENKPIASFLFMGPTGVGKTESAKALSQAYFGNEERMIRMDMSEYQTPTAIERLIGSASLNKPGVLINKVKDNPFSLLLLDEIEKAYVDILDVFLQVLDEGYLTDAFGKKVSFRNMIIIATSNAGAPIIRKMITEKRANEEINKAVIDYAIENGVFKPEFINRFNGVIFFRPLTENEIVSVTRLLVNKFAKRLKEEKNIEIIVSNETIKNISQSGYDPVFGARSLQRYVEDKIEDLIAKKIISGEIKKGEKVNVSI